MHGRCGVLHRPSFAWKVDLQRASILLLTPDEILTTRPAFDMTPPTTDAYTLHRGRSPLLISLPHVGTVIPADQQHCYTPRALETEDTDWFLDRVYDFAAPLGATLIVPRYSRYLVDLNRSSDNAPMYPGQNNTELCPTRHFTGEPLYRDGLAPDAAEIGRRVARYWQPYHDALRDELALLRSTHEIGRAHV